MALEIIFDNINILTPIFLGIGAALGIFLGIFLSKPRKNQVMKILPSDNRGFQFNVAKETAFSLTCKGFDGLPDQRFIKNEPSVILKIKKLFGKPQQVVRYLAREGTAYVQKASKDAKDIPLHKAIRTLVGETFYSQMPSEITDLFETAKVGVTVGLDPVPLKTNLRPVSEEDLKTEEDKQASATFWSEKAKSNRNQWINSLAWIGFGFGVALVVCLLMGWIQLAI